MQVRYICTYLDAQLASAGLAKRKQFPRLALRHAGYGMQVTVCRLQHAAFDTQVLEHASELKLNVILVYRYIRCQMIFNLI